MPSARIEPRPSASQATILNRCATEPTDRLVLQTSLYSNSVRARTTRVLRRTLLIRKSPLNETPS